MTGTLLAIVEVPREKRVVCQATGCGHAVYKRIHVVGVDGAVRALGSDCFAKLFGAAGKQSPRYGGADGRRLTDQERELLHENTAALIAQFEAERAALELAKRVRPDAASNTPRRDGRTGQGVFGLTPEMLRAYELQAKLDVRAKYDVDPNLPGWRGLVLNRVRELADEASARRNSSPP